MIQIRVTEKNVDGVLENLKTTEDRVRGALAVGLSRGLQITAGVAQVNYLSGPRPEKLQSKTARLYNSIVTEVDVSNNEITGRIGSNLPYAGYHEFGFHGVEIVGAHTRVTHRVNGIGQVLRGGKKLARKQKAGFAGVTFVKQYKREVDYAGRPFLRPALEQTKAQIAESINTELKKISNGT
jgi:phage gpG-like protein